MYITNEWMQKRQTKHGTKDVSDIKTSFGGQIYTGTGSNLPLVLLECISWFGISAKRANFLYTCTFVLLNFLKDILFSTKIELRSSRLNVHVGGLQVQAIWPLSNYEIHIHLPVYKNGPKRFYFRVTLWISNYDGYMIVHTDPPNIHFRCRGWKKCCLKTVIYDMDVIGVFTVCFFKIRKMSYLWHTRMFLR